ncbi:hypothetical protein GCM10020216_097340 [Nonomuraea helvata]
MDPPFFYLDKQRGTLARTTTAAVAATSMVGIVPMLVPIEHQETVLSDSHVARHQLSRLTSRHFRNQLYHLRSRDQAAYEAFTSFVLDNTPELDSFRLHVSDGINLDVYYREVGARTEKEIFWAGDGLQIWVQVLYHLWRQQESDTLVLDEPDVFLHPDLQRRLVGIIEESRQQVIFATHAPEILTEAARESIIWIDRTKQNSKRVHDESLLSDINLKLGSGFNLGMARALRSRVALFVEGYDMRVLRNMARIARAKRLAGERGVTVIPLRGFTNWSHVEPFAWMTRDLLGEAIEIYVILDRDYRTNEQVYDVTHALQSAGVRPHVWRRKELESYLLVPSAIARLVDIEADEIAQILEAGVADARDGVFANFAYERKKTDPSKHDVTHTQEALKEFEQLWKIPENRLHMSPPKDLLSHLNRHFAANKIKTISTRAISNRLRLDELTSEMIDLFSSIEEHL